MAEIVLAAAIPAIVGGTALAFSVPGVTLAGVLLSVGVTALSATASYLLRPNLGVPKVAAPANGERTIPIAQPVPPRIFAYGRVRTGGTLLFEENDNPYLYLLLALSDGVIEGVVSVYFGAEALPVDVNGDAVSGTRWYTHFSMETANGETDQAASVMITGAFPLTTDSTFRQRGVARIAMQLDWGTDAAQHSSLWGDTLRPSIILDGVKVYDPRVPSQSFADPTTWTFSSNPALCTAHALTNAWGVALPESAIDWASVRVAADVCDTVITVGDIDYPTFSLAGLFQADADLGAQIQDMLSSFRGRITFRSGKYAIVADAAGSSVWTIGDDDVLGLGDFVSGSDARAIFNAISASYYSLTEEGQRTTTAVYEMTTEIAAEGLRETSLTLPFTAYSHSAQIIAYRELIEARDGRALNLNVRDSGIDLEPGDVVTLALTYAPYLNGTYRVTQIDVADVGVVLTLKGYSADVYADPATYLV